MRLSRHGSEIGWTLCWQSQTVGIFSFSPPRSHTFKSLVLRRVLVDRHIGDAENFVTLTKMKADRPLVGFAEKQKINLLIRIAEKSRNYWLTMIFLFPEITLVVIKSRQKK